MESCALKRRGNAVIYLVVVGTRSTRFSYVATLQSRNDVRSTALTVLEYGEDGGASGGRVSGESGQNVDDDVSRSRGERGRLFSSVIA